MSRREEFLEPSPHQTPLSNGSHTGTSDHQAANPEIHTPASASSDHYPARRKISGTPPSSPHTPCERHNPPGPYDNIHPGKIPSPEHDNTAPNRHPSHFAPWTKRRFAPRPAPAQNAYAATRTLPGLLPTSCLKRRQPSAEGLTARAVEHIAEITRVHPHRLRHPHQRPVFLQIRPLHASVSPGGPCFSASLRTVDSLAPAHLALRAAFGSLPCTCPPFLGALPGQTFVLPSSTIALSRGFFQGRSDSRKLTGSRPHMAPTTHLEFIPTFVRMTEHFRASNSAPRPTEPPSSPTALPNNLQSKKTFCSAIRLRSTHRCHQEGPASPLRFGMLTLSLSLRLALWAAFGTLPCTCPRCLGALPGQTFVLTSSTIALSRGFCQDRFRSRTLTDSRPHTAPQLTPNLFQHS